MLFRLLLITAIFYIAYRVYLWVAAELSDTYPCPNCDGKGYWESVRDRERCRECNATGRLPK